MVTYDASIIQQFAEKLYGQARTVLVVGAVLGFVLGCVAAAGLSATFTGHGPRVGMGELVVFGGMGALVGFLVARSRAFTLKLQAQMALCQAQIEVNTRHAQQIQNTKAA